MAVEGETTLEIEVWGHFISRARLPARRRLVLVAAMHVIGAHLHSCRLVEKVVKSVALIPKLQTSNLESRTLCSDRISSSDVATAECLTEFS